MPTRSQLEVASKWTNCVKILPLVRYCKLIRKASAFVLIPLGFCAVTLLSIGSASHASADAKNGPQTRLTFEDKQIQLKRSSFHPLVTQQAAPSLMSMENSGPPEDFDGSCIIDVVDIELIAGRWNALTNDANRTFDFNQDGAIDAVDVQHVAGRWGIRCITSNWLTYLNHYRATANLPELIENPAWSHGAWLHSRYMVKNDIIQHDEDPQNDWYTQEGELAGRHGNVAHVLNERTADLYEREVQVM